MLLRKASFELSQTVRGGRQHGPTTRRAWTMILLFSNVLFGLVSTCASAQTTPSDKTALPADITIEFLQAERAAIEKETGLDEPSKKSVLDVYQAAIEEFAKLKTAQETAASFDAEIESAPKKKEDAKLLRDRQPAPSENATTGAELPLSSLEKTLAETRKDLDIATKQLAELNAEPKRRTDRLTKIPASTRELKTKLESNERALSEEEQAGQLARAQRILLLVQSASWTASIESMEKEKQAYEATEELLRLEREIVAANVSRAKEQVERLQTVVNQRRKAEAQEQALAAREAAVQADPAVSALAQYIADLAQRRSKLADQMAQTSQNLESVRTTLKSIQTSFQKSKSRVDAGGLSEAAGNVLRQERKRLPNPAEHKRNIHVRQDLMGDVRFSLYDLEDHAIVIASASRQDNPDVARHRILRRLGLTQTAAPEVRQLLDQERELINKLIADSNHYLESLIELNAIEQELIDTTDAYAKFISERVLWIRSTHPLGRRDLRPALDATIWCGLPSNWLDVGRTLVADIRRNWVTFSTPAIAFLILVFFQRRLRFYVARTGRRVSKGAFAQFLPTLSTLVSTVLISIPWPLLLMFAGNSLQASLSESDFTAACGDALAVLAWCWIPIEFLRQLIRKDGLAEAHFVWPASGIRVIRSQLRSFRYLGLPFLFVVALMAYQQRESLWNSSLGRGAFVCLMLLVAYVLNRVLHPTKGALSEWSSWRSGWFYRFRHLWVGIATGGPVVMAILAVAGYYETALTIAVRLWATLCWAVVSIVLRSLLARWVLMNRRRIALDQWRRRKKELAENESQHEPSTPAIVTENDAIDLATVSIQTLKLIDTAIMTIGIVLVWLIWIDVLPALGIFRGVPIWPGAATPTLADVLLAVATLFFTYIAGRNIPGLLELGLLKHLPLDTGARYAVSSLTRYTLVIVGLSMAASFVGITWSSVQWLVAAIGIGLGFGLQEIFANFVSGIVLLFEQPLRVGDVVSLGQTTGVVSRIRIRATTITDLDHKEYVVPNKDLITGTLLNWTLSDQTTRIVVNVGVAYGSNTELARSLLEQCAKEHPHILDEPAPFGSFEGFGESSLNLILRCYLDSIEERWRTLNDLHTSIDREFRKAGIEIAFPQRDLHIRTVAQQNFVPTSWQGVPPKT